MNIFNNLVETLGSASFWINALQLILSLSLLVFVHEFGHYFFARLFKMRVDKFYLFFNPKFSLVRWDPKNRKVGFFVKNPDDEKEKTIATRGSSIPQRMRAVSADVTAICASSSAVGLGTTTQSA